MFTFINDTLQVKAGTNPEPFIVSRADAEMSGLYNYTLPEMATIHNDLLRFLTEKGLTEDMPKPVNRFSDKVAAVKRIRALRTYAITMFPAAKPKDTRSKEEKEEAARKATEALPPLQPPPAPAPRAKKAPVVLSPTAAPKASPTPLGGPAFAHSTYPAQATEAPAPKDGIVVVKSLKDHPLPKGVKGADVTGSGKVPFNGYTPWAVGQRWVGDDKSITRIETPQPHPDVAARFYLYTEGMTTGEAMKLMMAYMGRHPALKGKDEKARDHQALSWLRLDHRNGRIFVEGKDAEWGIKRRKKA